MYCELQDYVIIVTYYLMPILSCKDTLEMMRYLKHPQSVLMEWQWKGKIESLWDGMYEIVSET